jgi:hypothetical protein
VWTSSLLDDRSGGVVGGTLGRRPPQVDDSMTAPPASGTVRGVVRARATLVAIILMSASPAVVVAAEAAAAMTVEVVPPTATSGGGAMVRVANTGGTPLTGVVLDVEAPTTLTWALDRTDIGTLPPGGSALVALALDGMAATAVVSARGRAGDIPVGAAAAVELGSAPHTLALVGNTRMTDRSPADLVVVVTNAADATVNVELSASTSGGRATLDLRSFELRPGGVRDVALTVESDGTLRRGTVAVVVQATITGAGTQRLVETRELTVALAADELPGPLGVSSLVAVPGLVALLAFFEIRSKDRRRIGVAHPGAKVVWENKTWLLLAGGLGLAAVAVYDVVVGRDVLDAPLVRDITVLTVAVGGAGAVAALVSLWLHRKSTPIITPRSTPAQVLRAARRSHDKLERPRFRAGDNHGLLVHRDGDALVLTPPISFEPTGALFDAWDDRTDAERFEHLVAALPADFDGVFRPGSDDFAAPTAVAIEDAEEVGRAELLVTPD